MNTNLKVGFLIPDLSNGGAEKAMFNVASYFYQQGIQLQIIAGNTSGANLARLPENVPVFSLDNAAPLDSPSFFKNVKGIMKYARAQKPDVLICNSDYLNIAVVTARFFVKTKFKIIIAQQYHVGEFIKTLPLKNRLFLKFIQYGIARKADVIVGSSKGVAENYAALYHIKYPSAKIQAVYNPIYEEAIPALAAAVVTDTVFATGCIKLINVGRLLEQKDQVTLIKAFALFLKKERVAHLYIVGVGKEQAALEQLAHSLQVNEKISFLGYKENPFAYVAKCDLFVLSSRYEGFGNVVVEALATGVNVVSTDCPSGPAEILNNGEFGFLCPPCDPEALSETMITALRHKKPAALLINRAKGFSIEKTGQEYLDIVCELCN